MNKFGFISGILASIVLLLPFLPIGIYFGSASNPWLGFNFYVQFPVSIVRYGNMEVFLWGTLTNSSINFWVLSNIITFIFLTIIGILSVIFSFVGCFKEDKLGKRFMNFVLLANLFLILYILIGFTIYSREIFGTTFGLVDIYYHLDYGFYIIVLNLIISIAAFITHPIKEVTF
ncbi:MAG: membrane protein of unknown function [Promethearchaeota archaeon]|nr:MAG: membrane protein of unknown function [Candidatus Lokiarchaeota archaeon]